MKIDISGLSYSELETLKRTVEKKMASLEKRRKTEAKAAAEKAAKKFGFDLSELVGESAPKKARVSKPAKAGKAKYRNPADATQTWTGKGRQPQWFKDAIAGGTAKSDLEI